MRLIKRICKNTLHWFLRGIYNRKHSTNICSNRANLAAHYEKGVGIGENTFVSQDVCIGKYSYINRDSSAENCSIGNYCAISTGVFINPHEHELHFRSIHPFADKYTAQPQKRVVIGHDVLISLNAIVLSGVSIGNGAVIGAGAVVTKDVMPYEIVGGVPAKHIGWRFEKAEQDLLESTQWFLADMDTCQQNINFFTKQSDVFQTNTLEKEAL